MAECVYHRKYLEQRSINRDDDQQVQIYIYSLQAMMERKQSSKRRGSIESFMQQKKQASGDSDYYELESLRRKYKHLKRYISCKIVRFGTSCIMLCPC